MTSSATTLAAPTRALGRALLRQFRFPSPLRALVEVSMLVAVFLAAGKISLGHGVGEMLGPMVPVVLAMMLCSVASGVYRPEINNSIMNLYARSLYGFVLSTAAFLIVAALLVPEYTASRFVFFFLFFVFFVTNTIRPLISGTDFVDGGGRRGN